MDINTEQIALSLMIFTLAYIHKKLGGASALLGTDSKEVMIKRNDLNEGNSATKKSLYMNTISYLKHLTGNEKTLIISCIECCMEVEGLSNSQFYRHTTLGNVISQDSFREDSIRFYVESLKCTHIVVAGHADCKAIKSILNDAMDSASIVALKTEVQGVLISNHSQFLKTDLRELLVIELSVINLCRSLLQYSFIHERFKKEKMTISGIVFDHGGINKKIFYNGIVFNNLISNN